jgi:hypothetical protein
LEIGNGFVNDDFEPERSSFGSAVRSLSRTTIEPEVIGEVAVVVVVWRVRKAIADLAELKEENVGQRALMRMET